MVDVDVQPDVVHGRLDPLLVVDWNAEVLHAKPLGSGTAHHEEEWQNAQEQGWRDDTFLSKLCNTFVTTFSGTIYRKCVRLYRGCEMVKTTFHHFLTFKMATMPMIT